MLHFTSLTPWQQDLRWRLMVMEMLSAHCCEVNFNELSHSLRDPLRRKQQGFTFSLLAGRRCGCQSTSVDVVVVDFQQKIETIIRFIFFCVGSNLSGTILGGCWLLFDECSSRKWSKGFFLRPDPDRYLVSREKIGWLSEWNAGSNRILIGLNELLKCYGLI